MKHFIAGDHRLYVCGWNATLVLLAVVGLFADSPYMTDISAHTLLSSHNGPLYQFQRWSDGAIANPSTQDTFYTS